MKRITLFFFLCLFLLLRPYKLQYNGLMYTHDDYDYLAHSTALVFGEFPSYDKEMAFAEKGYRADGPECSIGAGLMASPFVLAFSQFDRIGNPGIFEERTKKNTMLSFTEFGFIVSSVVYFWLGCFLLFEGLGFHFSRKHAALCVILMVLAQGLPLFAFRRPLFSHIYEFFIQCVFVFLLLKNFAEIKKNRVSSGIGSGYAVLVGILSGLTVLVRLNNIALAVFWPVVLLIQKNRGRNRGMVLQGLGAVFAVAFTLILVFKIWPSMYTYTEGYASRLISQFYMIKEPLFYIRRLAHILIGIDWGLVFTAPFLLIGLGYLFFIPRSPLKRYLLVLLIPLVFNLYGIIMYRTQGGWYGYRYILAAAIPLVVYPFCALLQSVESKPVLRRVMITLAILPMMSMLAFEGNATNLTMTLTEQYFGVHDWSNNTYQAEIWKTLLFHPAEMAKAVFKAGPLYVIYLLTRATHTAQALPAQVLQKYKSFDPVVAVKMAVLYLIPFILYGIFCVLPKVKNPPVKKPPVP